MNAWNINWAFGDGGDVEDLGERAQHACHWQFDDGLWHEWCIFCFGFRGDKRKEADPNCEYCKGTGIGDDEGKTDKQMWECIWDCRMED